MEKNHTIEPFLKWAGGKRQLLPVIREMLPEDIGGCTYCEPFIGGGAVFLDLQPAQAVINDFNDELVNCYRVVRDHPDALIGELSGYRNEESFFYRIRSLDRDPGLAALSDVQRAARVIFLNRTCFNGLYRVNSRGFFNTPFGRYKSPTLVHAELLLAVSRYLNESAVQIHSGDYAVVLDNLPTKSFAYLDPPYHPVSRNGSFTSYVQGGWAEADQIRLRDACRSLDSRNIRFLLSNSSTPLIREIYREFSIRTVQAVRNINSKGNGRGSVDEVLVCNYR